MEHVVGRLESYDVLKRLFWMLRSGRLDASAVELVVVDRSVLEGVRVVKLSEDAILMKDRVVLPSGGTQIPLHRVVEVRVSGETLWRRGSGAPTRS